MKDRALRFPYRQDCQRLAVTCCLVGALLAVTPPGADAAGPFDLVSRAVLRVSEITPLLAVHLHEANQSISIDTKNALPAEGPATFVVEDLACHAEWQPAVAKQGIATWYGGPDGYGPDDTMADGTPFNPNDPTIAASNDWPLGTWLSVCHEERCIRTCVRDRGSFTHAVDLSMGAFALLAPLSSGVIDVTVAAYP